MSKFSEWLKKKGMTGYQFSRLYHLHIVTINKAERGDPVRIDTVKKICRFTRRELEPKDFVIARNPLTTTDILSN